MAKAVGGSGGYVPPDPPRGAVDDPVVPVPPQLVPVPLWDQVVRLDNILGGINWANPFNPVIGGHFGDPSDKTGEPLLLACLDEKQREEFIADRKFTVKGSAGGVFTVGCHSTTYNVSDGVVEWCAYAPGCPPCDTWLAQKLVLESDEVFFRGVAFSRSVKGSLFPVGEPLNVRVANAGGGGGQPYQWVIYDDAPVVLAAQGPVPFDGGRVEFTDGEPVAEVTDR